MHRVYKPYCFRCFIFQNPDHVVVRCFRTKEAALVEFVQKEFPNHNWINNKKIQDGCSKRRPDLFVDLLTHVIVVECDEGEHATKDYESCENKRIMEISQDVAHRPVVFIRLNPDGYTDSKTNKRVPTCWKKNSFGLTSIKDHKGWQARLKCLRSVIQKHIDCIPNKTITVEHLFFSATHKDEPDFRNLDLWLQETTRNLPDPLEQNLSEEITQVINECKKANKRMKLMLQ